MKYFFDWLLSLFKPSYTFSQEELAIIARITKEANDIAAGKSVTQSSLPEPTMPERRMRKR